jgi:hypothetical protein
MRSADYTRLALQLPASYQEDPVSWVQVDAYLGLVDELNHAYLERLEDLTLTFGPDAILRWPEPLPLDAGPDALLAAYEKTYDEVATWASFTFPASWPTGESGLARRREFLARAARLWRRRGTPRGFLDWFSMYFDVAPGDRPYLLEHFKAPGPPLPDPALTATLFVIATADFSDFRRRHEAIEFVNWYAPSHVAMRVCFINRATLPPAPPLLPVGPSPTDLTTYAAALATFRSDLRSLLCSVVSVIDHANGIHIWECIDEGRSIDRLDVGRLPTDE